MWIYQLILEITAYSSLALGLFVLAQNRRAKINQVFFAFSITVSIYTYFLKLGGFAQTPELALYFSRFMYLGVIMIPPIYYHLTMRLLGHDSKLIYGCYAISALFMAFLPTNLFISGTRYFAEFRIYSLRPGVLYVPFLFYFFAAAAYAIWGAYQQYRRSHGLRRRQLGYFVFGSIIGFVGGSIDFFPKFGIFIHPLNTYCNILIAVYIGFFAYAIVKYRLMDISVVIRKGLVYSLSIGIFTGIYISGIFLFGQALRGLTGDVSWLVPLAAIIVFSVVFQPLNNYIQGRIDRLFFKEKYNYQKTLRELSQATAAQVDLDKLLRLISRTIVDRIKIDRCSVYCYDRAALVFRPRETYNKASQDG
jgi:hypothetical protein